MTEKLAPVATVASTQPLPQVDRLEIKYIADGQADVTSDGGHRSPTWSPYLVDPEDQGFEHPYRN